MPATPRSRSLDVVLKITERCNLACTYCYFFFGGDESYLRHSPVIKPDTIDRLCDFLHQGVLELELDDLHLGLHGGEPLLMKKPAFDAMCTKLHAAMPERTRLFLGLQTNGVLIDEEWIALFEKHGVSIGISLDGPAAINDKARIDHKGRGSHDRVVAGLRIAQAAAEAGRIPMPGCLCVIDPTLDPAEIYDHIMDELGFRSVSFLLPREGWDSTIPIDAPLWRDYMRKLVAHWTSRTSKPAKVRVLSEPLTGLISDNGAEWRDWRIANRHNVMTVSSDGDLGPDDNLKPLDARFQETGMSIFDTSLHDFIASPLWREIVAGASYLPERCAACEWRRTCGSGDLFNRYGHDGGFTQPSVFCEAIDELHVELARYAVGHGVPAADIAQRLAAAPDYRAIDLLETNREPVLNAAE